MVRKAKKEDVKTINKLITYFIRDEANDYDENNRNDLIVMGYAEKRVDTEDNIIYVYEDKDEIVGFVSGSFQRGNTVKKTDEVKIEMLYVLDDYRNKGIGTKLIDAFVNECKEKNVSYVRIDNFLKNPAGNLYERLGFNPLVIERRKKI